MNFFDLHHQASPLLIGNVWDAASAQVAHAGGMQALGTSSAAMSAVLGFPDGEGMPFDALLGMVRRIAAASPLPLSVDLEAGHADEAAAIADHVRVLAELGVVGINLEDSHVLQGQRRLDPAAAFADKLQAIRGALRTSGTTMFINVRTDPFLLGQADALSETLARGRQYQQAGADGFFVPGITRDDDIRAVVETIALPLNVMAMPGLPDFATLSHLGVKRISMGNWLHAKLQGTLQGLYAEIQAQGSFRSVLG